jgi:hypothetical protein
MYHVPNPFFLKLLGLQKRSPKAFAGNWSQSCIVPFTKEYFPTSLFYFLLLFFLSTLLSVAFAVKSLNGLLCPFSRVRFEGRAYASYLSALCQALPVRIIPPMCKFSRFVLHPV